MNVDHTKELKHISLCTGYGGIDLGLSRALGAFRTVAYVEIEAFAIENLVAKIENELLDVAPIWTNLKTFPWKLYRGKVDIISGGFPCQPFSGAGQKKGDEDPRHLFPYIINGLRDLGRPSLVFLENVEGILSSKLKGNGWNDPEGTPVLLHVIRELERLGYDATAGVFSASEVGATHQRKRVFIMGCRSDLSETGRAIVSSMLRDTESRGSRVSVLAYPHSIRLQRSRSRERSAGVFAESTESSATTAYPAPRGAEQYPCEPPRVTMGDTKHARPPRAEERRGIDSPSNNSEERAQIPIKFKGASGHSRSRDISENFIMDNSNNEGSQGQATSRLQRERVRLLASRSSAYGNIHRKTQSSLGGNVDGATDWVDYAELCSSVDSHTDELRLLGNGVVPDTAERAFKELWADLKTR